MQKRNRKPDAKYVGATWHNLDWFIHLALVDHAGPITKKQIEELKNKTQEAEKISLTHEDETKIRQ